MLRDWHRRKAQRLSKDAEKQRNELEQLMERVEPLVRMSSAVDASAPRVGGFSYVPEIDGLRAVAVLSVMLCHLNKSLMPGGFVGVDVFFVISGYVVTASLSRDTSRSFLSMLMYFYSRRFLRIIPALIVCLIITAVLTSLFIPESWLSSNISETGLYAFFGASNFALLGADPYFSPRPEFNPFTHTWSLAIEEQFYLVLPTIFYLWANSNNWQRRWDAVICRLGIPILSAASFIWFVLTGTADQQINFYMLPGRFWELGIGAVLFQLQGAAKGGPSDNQRNWLLLLGVSIIGIAAIFADRNTFPFPWSIPPAVGSLMIIAAVSDRTGGQPSSSVVARALRARPAVAIGRISYSLYLWHWPIYTLFRWTIGLSSFVLEATALGLSFLLAYLSYALVEQPIRHGRWVLDRPRAVIITAGLASMLLGGETIRELLLGNEPLRIRIFQALAISSLLLLAFSTYAAVVQPKQRVRSVRGKPQLIMIVAGLAATLGGWQVARDVLRTDRLSLSVVTKFRSDWYPDLWPDSTTGSHCGVTYKFSGSDRGAATDLMQNSCAGEQASSRQMFVVGDSHALAYGALLQRIAREENVKIIRYTHAGCGFATLWIPTSPRCKEFVSGSLNNMIRNGHPHDLVFLPGLRTFRLSEPWGPASDENIEYRLKSAEALTKYRESYYEASDLIETLLNHKFSVVIEAPKPVFRSPPFRCSDWFNANNPVCDGGLFISRDELIEYREPVMDSIAALRERFPGLIIWDPFPILCPDDVCHAVTRAGPLFFDGDHLSGLANGLLYPHLASLLKDAWRTTSNQPSQ
jgi:peptidoglycan/LPS O-acetylase OafA/YrhL